MNPKQSFQETEYAKQWENIAESKAFRAATEAALLKMAIELSPTQESIWMIQGARDLVGNLVALHLKVGHTATKQDSTNLRHDV
jgi:hypothetical protein